MKSFKQKQKLYNKCFKSRTKENGEQSVKPTKICLRQSENLSLLLICKI